MTMIVNIQAEAAVLGAVLVDGTLFNDLVVQEEHFYEVRHRTIFQAMKKVADTDRLIDIITVTTALGNKITQVGGTTYLLEMAESIASTVPFKHHEQLILDAYRLRKSREFAINYVNKPTDQGLSSLINQLQECLQVPSTNQEQTIENYLIEITDEMCFPTDESSGFMTSFQDFDDMTGGLQRGDLIIVAARPSVGKTAFVLQLSANHAKNGGHTHIFSLEMGIKQLLQRMISAEAMINSQKWRHLVFSTEDFERAFHAIGKISDWNLSIYDSVRTVNEIRAAVRKQLHQDPDGQHLVIIDYLQLIPSIGPYERRDLEVGQITRELKQLAVDLKIPIVLVSQLSRGVEARQNKRPMMADLRESGNIEQDADVIAFLYRDDYYNHQTDNAGKMEIILAKQRNGPVGTIELVFDKAYGKFTNLDVKERLCKSYDISDG